MSETDTRFMELAIIEAQKSIPVDSAYCVGAILVSPTSNEILATGFSRELPGNTHAEECCLLKLSSFSNAVNSTMYTTMEPCGERLSGKLCCAARLIDAKVGRVVVGVGEPSTFIADSVGSIMLRNAGITVDYLKGYEEQCLAPNSHVLKNASTSSV
ncbi:DRAP deaminase [Nowakowskiella sp. JEL0407]|nr:DRAP deaminase [Nowakowskiella sp. JEL0407]